MMIAHGWEERDSSSQLDEILNSNNRYWIVIKFRSRNMKLSQEPTSAHFSHFIISVSSQDDDEVGGSKKKSKKQDRRYSSLFNDTF